MIRSDLEIKNIISNLSPALLIHLNSTLHYAQDDYFDCQVESGRKRNYLKKTIHHPNVASKNISVSRAITFFSAPLNQYYDEYTIESNKIMPIISNCAQTSKTVERLSAEFGKQKKQYLTLFFNKLSHLLSLQSLDIKLDIDKNVVDENMCHHIVNPLKAQLDLQQLKIFIYSKLGKKALGVLSQLVKRLRKLEIFQLRITRVGEFSKAEILEFIVNLGYLSNLKNLDLLVNGFKSEFYKISDSLCKLKQLEVLDLYFHSYDSPEDEFSFFSCLENLQKIKVLNLQIAIIMSSSLIIAYAKTLEHLVSLEKMITNINYDQSVDGIELIPKSLAKLHNFKALNLSINFSDTKISSSKFYHELRLVIGLEYLNLHLDDTLELEQLSYSLSHFSKLNSLKLIIIQDFQINSNVESMIRICDTIRNLNFLSKIDLMISGNRLPDFVVISALDCIQNLKHLKSYTLNIFQRIITALSQNIFVKLLDISPALLELESLSLSFNNQSLDENALDPLKMAIQNLMNIKSFNLNLRLSTELTNEIISGIIRSLAQLEKIEEITFKLNSQVNLIDMEIYRIFDDYFKSKRSLKATSLNFGFYIDEHEDDVFLLEIKNKYDSLKQKTAFLIDNY